MEGYIVARIVDTAERNYAEKVRLRNLRDNSNPFLMSDIKFKKLFRLPKSGVHLLIGLIEEDCLNRGKIPKYLKVLSALNYFAQGSYQTCIGQNNILALSQPSISRSIDLITKLICTKLSYKIKFPTTLEEKQLAKLEFQEMFQIRNTLGAIDCTHFSIVKPPINHPTAPGNIFYNRKGFYSINCQIVCSAKGKIISVNPDYPGSTHDAAIWRVSQLNQYLRIRYIQGEINQWLLGDRGYPLQPWILTPITEPENNSEQQYNECHSRARNIVEMTFGRLKNKFRCLHRDRTLHYSPEKAAQIIVSCCILHNMFINELSDSDSEDDEIMLDEQMAAEHESDELTQDFLAEARAIRAQFIYDNFNNS